LSRVILIIKKDRTSGKDIIIDDKRAEEKYFPKINECFETGVLVRKTRVRLSTSSFTTDVPKKRAITGISNWI
jgi:hypothetical protein